MNITKFINFINKQTKQNIDSSYYANIDIWREYWKGYVPTFHTVKETGLDGAKHNRDLYSLKMPKKACEDWASLLLNDKTTITLKDKKTAKWLVGDGQITGVLGKIKFWKNANAIVERAFWSGTGAFVISLEDMKVENGEIIPFEQTKINIDYLDASCIIPLTVKHGKIIDVAFATDVFIKGKKYIYLQTHILTKNGYQITNQFYMCEDEKIKEPRYSQVNLDGVAKRILTKSTVPLFAVFSPGIVKNIDGGEGLGMSVFAEAIDAAKQVDIAFNNYHRDLYLGGKKVFYNRKLTKEYITSTGEVITIAPDDVQQQLFYQSDDSDDIDGKSDVYEYNPSLRVDENRKAVQDALNYFSFKIGLGTRHYQFDGGNITTATQYNGDRQDMVQNANKHQIALEDALIDVVKAILWCGKNIQGQDIDENTDVTINWDDSYIMDSGARRNIDKDDALNGFIPKYKYNMEWRGMSEQEAKEAVAQAQSESGTDEQLGFGDI